MTGPLPSWAAPKSDGVPTPDSPLDRQLGAFIGPRWPVYRRKFLPFYEDGRFTPTWNWSAALTTLFGPFWFVYRRLYVPALLFWMLPAIVLQMMWNGGKVSLQDLMSGTETARDFQLVLPGVQLSIMVLAGGTANFLLYRRARAAIRLAEQRGDAEQQLVLLRTFGRANWIGVLLVLGLMLLASSGITRGAPVVP